MTDERHPPPAARLPHAALSPRELLAILLFWAFMAGLSAATRLIDPRTPLQAEIARAVTLVTAAEYALWAVLTVPIVWLASRYSLEEGVRVRRLLLFVALGLVVAWLVDHAIAMLRAELVPAPPRRGPRRPDVLREAGRELAREARRAAAGRGPGRLGLGFLDDLMVYFAVLGGGVARDYFRRYRAREAHAARLEAQLAEARLQTLRAQLDPHFLFNTMNAISALVERDPRGVRKMIARLSELLRHSLEEAPRQEVTLDEELALLRRYLDIMEVRHQGRLQVTVDADPALGAALVPHFVLQPLAENAFTHGVDRVEGTVRVAVTARRVGDDLVLSVRDDGPGPHEPSDRAGTGVGLRNTRERLAQLHGDRARLELRAAEGGGAEAMVRLPLRFARDARG